MKKIALCLFLVFIGEMLQISFSFELYLKYKLSIYQIFRDYERNISCSSFYFKQQERRIANDKHKFQIERETNLRINLLLKLFQ